MKYGIDLFAMAKNVVSYGGVLGVVFVIDMCLQHYSFYVNCCKPVPLQYNYSLHWDILSRDTAFLPK